MPRIDRRMRLSSRIIPSFLLAATLLVHAGIAVAGGDTMRAIRIDAYGDADVLRIQRIALPVPGPGELLVRVHATSINPIDTVIRAGHTGDMLGVTLPYVPGFDLSGEIAATGEGIDHLRPGDAVFAMLDLRRGGAYAEYALVKANEVAAKPARATHIEAAALPLVALTAWQALFATADLQPGQTVLIHAGAGGVGTMAVQLAKWKGATVVATASADNHDFLRGLGADRVIDYRNERFDELLQDVDVVLDPVGGDTQLRSLTVLREGGILVSLVGLTPAAQAPTRNVRARAILVAPDAEQLARIAELVDAGQLKPIVSNTLALTEAAEAHRLSETRRTRGKLVLRVGD